MKNKIWLLLSFMLIFVNEKNEAQPVQRNIRTAEYKALQQSLVKGWNTWYVNSMTSHVLLPEGFSINLCFTHPGNADYAKQIFKAADIQELSAKVVPGLRADDGAYTSLKLIYQKEELLIESATDGADEIILVSPIKEAGNYLVVEAGILWNREGSIGRTHNQITGKFSDKTILVSTTATPIPDAYSATTSPHLSFPTKNEIGVYTGRNRTLAEIKTIIATARKKQEARVASYGDLSESFKAMQTILAWNTTYDAPNNRAISPVSRRWSNGWGGFVLFDWDNYFASYMSALFNKKLAYINAIEITKSITPSGLVPNYQSPYGNTSWDRSEPPIGAITVLNIYKKYKEKWFLTEVYDELLSWNRYWDKHRSSDGYLCWGSDKVADTLKTIEVHNLQAAKFESGLDNSPMFDNVPFNEKTNMMEQADVGLMSMYILDCHALAEISEALGKKKEADELNVRASAYTTKLGTMWDEEKGIFLNRRTDNGEKSYRLSPTNFYPMLAKACTQQQAERMMKEHYFNTNEFYGDYVMPSISRNDPAFKDNDYWRGRIWGPMNFLVYMGMENYDVKEARADLIKKSKALLMKNWNAEGGVYENYNSVTGEGGDVKSADAFYHWGALLTFMEFIEKGYMKQ